MNENGYSRQIFYILLLFSVIAIGALCKFMSSFVLPVVIAAILSLAFLPVIKRLNSRLKLPWVLATILVIILFLIAFFGISSLLVSGLSSIISEYPKYESKFLSIYQILAERFNLEFDEGASFIQNLWKNLKVQEYAQRLAVFLSSGVVSFSKNLFLILIMCVFIELEIRLTKDKIHSAFLPDSDNFSRITHQIVNDTVRYISIKFMISLATGILVFLVTWLIGMDFPIVWAFVAFVMNFIPIFGSVFSVGITTLFSLMQFSPSFAKPVFILIFMTAINMVLGNILEPKIEGENLGLSPFVILVSLSLWGYIWGFVGMILAVPLTVIIKIICENIEDLRSIAILLGNSNKNDE